MFMPDPYITSHDWPSTLRAGFELAAEQCRRDVVPDERHVMWALLREAAQTSRYAYSAPPRSGWPRKSSMPDAPDDVSYWAQWMAYVRGVLQDMPEAEGRPPMPSAKQITRAEVVLHIWHHHAFARKGAKNKIKKAVYMKACDVAVRKIRAITGLTKQQIHAAQMEAMRDMWNAVSRG